MTTNRRNAKKYKTEYELQCDIDVTAVFTMNKGSLFLKNVNVVKSAANAKDFDGNVIRDLVTDDEGITGYTPYLKQGSYVVFETTAPKYMEVNYERYL